jgi:hypothetical protein
MGKTPVKPRHTNTNDFLKYSFSKISGDFLILALTRIRMHKTAAGINSENSLLII